MQQELDKTMTSYMHPRDSIESDLFYISENQFIWNDAVYKVNSDKTVEKLPDDVSPEFDLDTICREHEKLLKRVIDK